MYSAPWPFRLSASGRNKYPSIHPTPDCVRQQQGYYQQALYDPDIAYFNFPAPIHCSLALSHLTATLVMASTIFGVPAPSSVIAQLTPIDSPDGIAIAVWRGRRFISTDVIAGKGARGRCSWIRNHGIFVTELVGEDDATGKPSTSNGSLSANIVKVKATGSVGTARSHIPSPSSTPPPPHQR